MIEIIQNIIDLLTYTPTLYVDGMVCEVQGAVGWVAALPYIISAVGSVAGSAMSANASAMSASKMKKAAKKNYNMLMENADMSKMTLNEQMDLYKEDMDSYRSSMIQRYGLAGGIDPNTAQLNEVRDYQFDTDKSIDIDVLKKEYDEKWRKENADKEKWVKDKASQYIKEKSDEIYAKTHDKFGRELENAPVTRQTYRQLDRKAAEQRFGKEYDKMYGAPSKEMSDQDWTDELGKMLKDYQGKQTPWDERGSFFKSSRKGTGPAESSAILNLRTSVSNMQRDINNAYKAGMIDYWRQRENAQLTKDTYQFQAAQYSSQAQTTLASGFLSAFKYGAQAYSAYKS